MPKPRIGRDPLVVKTFRVEPTVWNTALARAKQNGIGVAELVRIALMQYLERNPVDTALAGYSIQDRIALANAHAEEAHPNGRVRNPGECATCDYYLG